MVLAAGFKVVWRALLGPVGIVLALGAAAAGLWKFWRASQAPGPKLERLKTRLHEVNERLADLGGGAKGEARALETLKTSLEQQIEATERLKVAKSDLGKTLEALAARDMAAWNEKSEEARRRAEALAGDLPEATLQMDALVEAVRTFGRDGKLTPAVMQEIARRARELGVPVSDLPPELRNIVEAFDRANAAAATAADDGLPTAETALDDVTDAAGETSDAVDDVAQSFDDLVAAEVRAIRESRRLAGIRAAAEALIAREDRAAAAVGPRVPFQLALPEGSVEALAAGGVIGPIEIPTQYGAPRRAPHMAIAATATIRCPGHLAAERNRADRGAETTLQLGSTSASSCAVIWREQASDRDVRRRRPRPAAGPEPWVGRLDGAADALGQPLGVCMHGRGDALAVALRQRRERLAAGVVVELGVQRRHAAAEWAVERDRAVVDGQHQIPERDVVTQEISGWPARAAPGHDGGGVRSAGQHRHVVDLQRPAVDGDFERAPVSSHGYSSRRGSEEFRGTTVAAQVMTGGIDTS